MKREYGAVVHW